MFGDVHLVLSFSQIIIDVDVSVSMLSLVFMSASMLLVYKKDDVEKFYHDAWCNTDMVTTQL